MKVAVTAFVPLGLQSCAVKGNEIVSLWSESVSLSDSPSLETSRVGFVKTLLNQLIGLPEPGSYWVLIHFL